MNTKDYEYNENEKYKSFLQIIAIISLFTVFFEGGRFLLHVGELDSIQKIFAVTSIVLLLFILAIGLIFANGLSLHVDFIDDFVTRKRKRNDITVTILFFSFLASTVLFIIQEGGAKNSGMTNILLLCANFGFFFAQKIRIKYIALISCLMGYFFCNIFSYTCAKGFFFSKPDFSAVITTIMSILFNLIITSNVNWIIQNNGDKDNQAVENNQS